MGEKKMGRPTDSLKDTMIKFRIDKVTRDMLVKCSKRLNISQSEVIRNGIRKTFEDLPEK